MKSNLDLVYQKYYQGFSLKQIAFDLGISYQSLLKSIDRSKLTRPYQNPQWLKEHYLDKNLSTSDLAKLANTTNVTIGTWLAKFSIKKEQSKVSEAHAKKVKKTCLDKWGKESYMATEEFRAKSRETSLRKWGVANPASSPEIKEKIKKINHSKWGENHYLLTEEGMTKSRETSLKNWGADCFLASEIGRDKAARKMFEKWGVDSPLKSAEIKAKQEQTMIERWGAKYALQSEDLKVKQQETMLEKWGVLNPNQNADLLEKSIKTKIKRGHLKTLNGKLIANLAKETGVPASSLYYLRNQWGDDQAASYLDSWSSSQSNLESIIAKATNLDFYNKFFDSDLYPNLRYKPDFKISDQIALNVDGLYWHSELNKKREYHWDMRVAYQQLGLRIIQIREDEVRERLPVVKSVINHLRNKTPNRIFARKCKVLRVNQGIAAPFYQANHLMGSVQAKHLGLFCGNQLISIMSWKTYKNKIKIERFCSKINYQAIGGFSKLLSYILSENTLPVHYWVDLRYGTGNFLSKMGFKMSRETRGWKWTDGYKTYHRLRCRANMDARKLSQAELAQELGWFKIWDAGQRLWILPVRTKK